MNQDAARTFDEISAFLDGAMAQTERRAFLLRLEQEPDLAAQVEAERRFRQGFRTAVRRETAPAALRTRHSAALAAELGTEGLGTEGLGTEGLGTEELNATTATAAASQAGERRWTDRFPWLQAAWWTAPRSMTPVFTAALALAVVVIMGGSTWAVSYMGRGENHSVVRQMAGRHRVYFSNSPQPILDIAAPADEIRTWALSLVPFPVDAIPDLAGWHLKGARLGEFHHRGTISLLYVPDAVNDDPIASAQNQISLTLFFPQPKDFPEENRQMVQGRPYFVGEDENNVVVLWRDSEDAPEVGFALIGEPSFSAEALLTLAESIRAGP